MKRVILFTVAIIALINLSYAFDKQEKQDIKKTLKFSTADKDSRLLLVDNINGAITVTGYDGEEVQLLVHETINAESDKRMREAKEEVTIETKEDGDRIRIYVDGPWRKSDGSCNYRGFDYYGYEVSCDFELKVPHKLNLRLKTVNDGAIKVNAVDGEFEVNNVNGNIWLVDIGGSGKAVTVNGNVEASFKNNPTEKSSFRTVNGEIDVKFQSNLKADLEFSTMNGEVYSDFDMKSLPSKSNTSKRRNGMIVYKSGDSFSVRVGDGGPDISMNTLNGDITVSKY